MSILTHLSTIRTGLLFLAAIGIAPAVLIAVVTLIAGARVGWSSPFSIATTWFSTDGKPVPAGSVLDISATTSLLILLGAAIVLCGIYSIQTRTLPPRSPDQTPTANGRNV